MIKHRFWEEHIESIKRATGRSVVLLEPGSSSLVKLAKENPEEDRLGWEKVGIAEDGSGDALYFNPRTGAEHVFAFPVLPIAQEQYGRWRRRPDINRVLSPINHGWGDLIIKNLQKESKMTAKEMLEAPIYNAAGECPKCGWHETEDVYCRNGVALSGDFYVAPFFRSIQRKCKGCGAFRIEKPKDWTDEEQIRLGVWCNVLADREVAENKMKRLIVDAEAEANDA